MELSYHIPFHIPRFLAEIHTDSHQVLSIQRKKNQIPFFVNLAQSLLGTAVQLEFKHINGIFGRYHRIRTAAGTTNFRFDKLFQQGKDYIEDSLIVTLGIVAQLVRNIGKKRLSGVP